MRRSLFIALVALNLMPLAAEAKPRPVVTVEGRRGHGHGWKRGRDGYGPPPGRGWRRRRWEHVRYAPPPVRVEVRPAAPSPRHYWVPGYWAWRGNTHVWNAGYWARPPSAGVVWVEPRWVQDNGEWYFEDGEWVPAGSAGAPPPVVVTQSPPPPPPPVYQQPVSPPPPAYQGPPPAYPPPAAPAYQPTSGEVIVSQAPPPVRAEAQPPIPGPGFSWVAGYWAWQGGRFVWISGRWEAGHPGTVWEAARWAQQGPYWRFVPGRWRRY
jgi:hypothetical protein